MPLSDTKVNFCQSQETFFIALRTREKITKLKKSEIREVLERVITAVKCIFILNNKKRANH